MMDKLRNQPDRGVSRLTTRCADTCYELLTRSSGQC